MNHMRKYFQKLTCGDVYDIAAIVIGVFTMFILNYTDMRNYHKHILFLGSIAFCLLPYICKRGIKDIENVPFFKNQN